MLPVLASLVGLLLVPTALQDEDQPSIREQVSAQMKVVRSRRAPLGDRLDAMEVLLELGPDGAWSLASYLSRELPGLRRDRLEAQGKLSGRFEAQARRIGSDKAGESAAEVDRLRAVVLGGPVTKSSISGEKDPAVARLRELLLVSNDDVWEAEEGLYDDFCEVLDALDEEDLLFGYWWDAREVVAEGDGGERAAARLKDLPDPAGDTDLLLDELDLYSRYGMAMAEADRRVMRANSADFEGLDPKEADGIIALNDLRVLVGRTALRLDLKLSRACRGHSVDMVEHGFFAHSSPIEGKETPWKRAALEGTSAGAENIAAGAAEGPAAIRMWWYSPGHHRNMMGGHRRVGLGRHGEHWTQCFGG